MIHAGETSRGRRYEINEDWQVALPEMGITSQVRDVRGGQMYCADITYQGKRMALQVEPDIQGKREVQRLWDERKRQEREAREADPAYQRRQLVSAISAARDDIERAMDRGDDPGRAYRAEAEAREALAAWDAEHGEDAEQIKREARATELERQAAIALRSDADGWHDAEHRQARHDELIAEAAQVRAAS